MVHDDSIYSYWLAPKQSQPAVPCTLICPLVIPTMDILLMHLLTSPSSLRLLHWSARKYVHGSVLDFVPPFTYRDA